MNTNTSELGTKNKIAVMQAYVEGKCIEMISNSTGSRCDWVTSESPCWDWNGYDYRIKPMPKRRPWTFEEVPVGAIVRSNPGGYLQMRLLIVGVKENRINTIEDGAIKTRLLSEFIGAGNEVSIDGGKTWQPIGVEVAE